MECAHGFQQAAGGCSCQKEVQGTSGRRAFDVQALTLLVLVPKFTICFVADEFCFEVAFCSTSWFQVSAVRTRREQGAITAGRHVATALPLPETGPL
jgi:hypothetical protein